MRTQVKTQTMISIKSKRNKLIGYNFNVKINYKRCFKLKIEKTNLMMIKPISRMMR